MPTYTFTRTRDQIAGLVLRKLVLYGPGDTVDADDATVVYEAMDLRLKEMHALGILWWQVSGATTDVALTSGQVTATISPAANDFLFAVSMALRVGTDDRPLEIIDHLTYQRIENKTDQGEPERVFIDGATCRFWPVPDANYTAKLTYESIAADTEGATAPDIRVESMRALVVVIAADVADDFSVPEQKVQRLKAESVGAMHLIRTLNTQRVDTTTVAPDYF